MFITVTVRPKPKNITWILNVNFCMDSPVVSVCWAPCTSKYYPFVTVVPLQQFRSTPSDIFPNVVCDYRAPDICNPNNQPVPCCQRPEVVGTAREPWSWALCFWWQQWALSLCCCKLCMVAVWTCITARTWVFEFAWFCIMYRVCICNIEYSYLVHLNNSSRLYWLCLCLYL